MKFKKKYAYTSLFFIKNLAKIFVYAVFMCAPLWAMEQAPGQEISTTIVLATTMQAKKGVSCPICYKSFNLYPHRLKLHLGMHTKPFACNYPGCDYTASQEIHLTCHQKKHTGENFFVCDSPGCVYKATTKKHLESHKKIHTGNIRCDISECPFICGTSKALVRHKKLAHNPNPNQINTTLPEKIVLTIQKEDSCLPENFSETEKPTPIAENDVLQAEQVRLEFIRENILRHMNGLPMAEPVREECVENKEACRHPEDFSYTEKYAPIVKNDELPAKRAIGDNPVDTNTPKTDNPCQGKTLGEPKSFPAVVSHNKNSLAISHEISEGFLQANKRHHAIEEDLVTTPKKDSEDFSDTEKRLLALKYEQKRLEFIRENILRHMNGLPMAELTRENSSIEVLKNPETLNAYPHEPLDEPNKHQESAQASLDGWLPTKNSYEQPMLAQEYSQEHSMETLLPSNLTYNFGF